jgi:hypothetical protein
VNATVPPGECSFQRRGRRVFNLTRAGAQPLAGAVKATRLNTTMRRATLPSKDTFRAGTRRCPRVRKSRRHRGSWVEANFLSALRVSWEPTAPYPAVGSPPEPGHGMERVLENRRGLPASPFVSAENNETSRQRDSLQKGRSATCHGVTRRPDRCGGPDQDAVALRSSTAVSSPPTPCGKSSM